jgi:hypothetical protein
MLAPFCLVMAKDAKDDTIFELRLNCLIWCLVFYLFNE